VDPDAELSEVPAAAAAAEMALAEMALAEMALAETGHPVASADPEQGKGTSGRSSAREAVSHAVDRLHVAGFALLRLDLTA
jgi:hypothetical protein